MITFQNLGRYGRLCNGMFQVAGTIGIARKNGYQFCFPEWKNYDHRDRFGSSEDIDIQKYFLNPLPVLNDPKYRDFPISWGYHGFDVPDDVSLSGHMQSEKYFKHCESEIRHYFSFRDPYPKNDFCAVHVRLGDYDNNFHPRLNEEYYGKAIAQFPESTRLLLFSDSVEEAKEMILRIDPKLRERLYISDSNNYIEDLKFMSACKDFIIGNSTFSWWGAYLGEHPEKKVIAPANWFGPSWGSGYKTMADDIFAENWIVL